MVLCLSTLLLESTTFKPELQQRVTGGQSPSIWVQSKLARSFLKVNASSTPTLYQAKDKSLSKLNPLQLGRSTVVWTIANGPHVS